MRHLREICALCHPAHARRVACSTWWPCSLLDAHECLRFDRDVMANFASAAIGRGVRVGLGIWGRPDPYHNALVNIPLNAITIVHGKFNIENHRHLRAIDGFQVRHLPAQFPPFGPF